MAQLAPFTLYLKLDPNQSNTLNRWEQIRELEKIGYQIYQALANDSQLQLAQPGGGQAVNLEQFGLQQYGVAVKPRFGATPAQATITGFFDITNLNVGQQAGDPPVLSTQPYPNTQVICGGELVSGPMGAQPWATNPQPWVAEVVAALKAQVEQDLFENLPATIVASVFRIDYQGSIYGDGGFHFPQ